MPKAVSISREVRDVLARSTVAGSQERPTLKLPDEQLNRLIYEATAKVIKALGGKWNRSAGGFLFDRPFVGELAEALATGKAVDVKRSAEQFFTPHALVERMCDLLDLHLPDGMSWSGITVLEPSAGDGRMAFAAAERGSVVLACELDATLASKLGRTNVAYHHGDFMEYVPRDIGGKPYRIDRVLMNPPFSKNQDIAHVTRALSFLRPGGKLAAIMSPHFTFADDRASREFRDLIRMPQPETRLIRWARAGEVASGMIEHCEIELLPANTFQAEGTNVNAVLVLIEKAA